MWLWRVACLLWAWFPICRIRHWTRSPSSFLELMFVKYLLYSRGHARKVPIDEGRSLPFYRLKQLKLAAWMSMITFTARMDLSQPLNPALLASSPVSLLSPPAGCSLLNKSFFLRDFPSCGSRGFKDRVHRPLISEQDP